MTDYVPMTRDAYERKKEEIAHMEKNILDKFGTTDFEIGEGFLERGIGKDDPGSCRVFNGMLGLTLLS